MHMLHGIGFRNTQLTFSYAVGSFVRFKPTLSIYMGHANFIIIPAAIPNKYNFIINGFRMFLDKHIQWLQYLLTTMPHYIPALIQTKLSLSLQQGLLLHNNKDNILFLFVFIFLLNMVYRHTWCLITKF